MHRDRKQRNTFWNLKHDCKRRVNHQLFTILCQKVQLNSNLSEAQLAMQVGREQVSATSLNSLVKFSRLSIVPSHYHAALLANAVALHTAGGDQAGWLARTAFVLDRVCGTCCRGWVDFCIALPQNTVSYAAGGRGDSIIARSASDIM